MSVILAAGVPTYFSKVGDYFHLLDTSSPIDVDFISDGAVDSRAQQMEFGFYAKPAKGYTGFILTSNLGQTVKIAVGVGDAGYNRVSGSVQVIGQQGAITEGQVQLTNANQTIIAARASGKFAMVQNNDPAAVMRVTIDGAAASATRGFRLQPGQPMDFTVYNPTGAINACMETATAAAANCEFAAG
jgi:hypothetical protein